MMTGTHTVEPGRGWEHRAAPLAEGVSVTCLGVDPTRRGGW